MKISETILCLDVSLRSTGFAVYNKERRRFVDWGCFQTESRKKEDGTYQSEDNARRYREMAWSLRNVVKTYSPAVVLAEMPSGGAQSQKAAVAMASSAAVVVTTVYLLGLRLFQIQPLQVKRLVASHGPVPKIAIQRLVRATFNVRLPDDARAEHIADAMATLLVARKRWKEIC